MSLPEVLRGITAALDHAGATYMLTGSFASAYYAPPPAPSLKAESRLL